MGEATTRTPVRVLAAACALLALCLTVFTPTAGATSACVGAAAAARTDAVPSRGQALLCAVNEVRALHGLRPLKLDWKLTAAAGAHAADMVRRSYFAHVSPDGVDLTRRVKRTGWIPRLRDWELGETLALGCGLLSSPVAAVEGWMHSDGHRAVILDPRMRRGGIGLVDAGDCSTWVLDVGRRY